MYYKEGMVVTMVGMFATSKAGHDKNNIYIIIEEQGEYVYLVDGVLKTMERPKKKKKKHIQIIKKIYHAQLQDKVIKKEKVSDVEIKRAVKLFELEHETVAVEDQQ